MRETRTPILVPLGKVLAAVPDVVQVTLETSRGQSNSDRAAGVDLVEYSLSNASQVALLVKPRTGLKFYPPPAIRRTG